LNDKKIFLTGLALGVALSVTVAFAAADTASFLNRNNPDPQAKIGMISNILKNNYVGQLDSQKMLDTMYSGFVAGVGDRYTSYMDKTTFAAFTQLTEGQYAGVGCVVGADAADNRIKILTCYAGSPAHKAGIRDNDKILKVNGTEIRGDDYQNAVALIKGKPGTSVDLTIHRDSTDTTFDVSVTRENVTIPTVSDKILDGEIGYIDITSFDRVTFDQFSKAYNDLNGQRVKGLIIDVRNNPGGLLKTVTDIANLLVPKGCIVYTEDKDGNRNYTYSDGDRVDVPLALLVNGNSASASEVLAGAVKDMEAGVLVGTQTFGKGLVQTIYPLPDGSAVKVTIAKYYTPSGVCINGTGIAPDFVVDMPENLSDNFLNIPPSEDAQLQKALEVVHQKIGD